MNQPEKQASNTGDPFENPEDIQKREQIELAESDTSIMPLVAGGLRIGGVDEVNGRGAGLIRPFIPTKYEVLQLVKHWAGVKYRIEFNWWVDAQYGSDESRRVAFANRRIAQAAECLGEEEVYKTVESVFEDFGRQQHPKLWAAFISDADVRRTADGTVIID
jgi:hypothetical protein